MKLSFPGRPQSPDLLVLDNRDATLFVIEFKNYIPPLDVGTVCNRVEEARKGISQAQRYMALIHTNPAVVERAIQQTLSGWSIKGVLLTRHPMPLPIDPPDDVSVVDWPFLRRVLENDSSVRFSNAISRAVPQNAEPLEFGEDEIHVRRWTYRRVLPPRTPVK